MSKDLTKAEEQVMQVLWQINGGFVKEILAQMPSPQPAYNTVSTLVRILVQKDFVKAEPHGRTHKYIPLVSQQEYASFSMNKLLHGYFGDSVEKMLSFFVRDKNLSAIELDELLTKIKKND